MNEMSKTQFQEWVDGRASILRSQYSTYDCLKENGFGEAIPDNSTPTQISCPVHGADTRPSARYYPSDGRRGDYVHCFACKLHADSIGLYSKFKGIKWFDALKELERRFGIKVSRAPNGAEIQEPVDKTSSKYESDLWSDVPQMLVMLEKKLKRIRDRVTMDDYIKFCRVIDNVQWDLDHTEQMVTPDMVIVLKKVYDKMNALLSIDMNV